MTDAPTLGFPRRRSRRRPHHARASWSTNAWQRSPIPTARARAPSCMSMPKPRSRPPKRWTGCARSRPRRRHSPAFPISIKDLFDIKGQVTRAGSRALEDSRAGGGRCARGGAAAARRFCRDRPHQHDRVRLFRHRHQSALRHAEGRMAAQRRPCARRIVVGRGGLGRRRHGAWRAGHRHRRLLPDSGGV